MSRKCGECSNFDRLLSKCNKLQDDSIREADTVICCPFYELRPQTVFDRITASPEVLAPCFVEKQPDKWDDDDYPYYSYLTKEWYATEEAAIAATAAKLNEVCDDRR